MDKETESYFKEINNKFPFVKRSSRDTEVFDYTDLDVELKNVSIPHIHIIENDTLLVAEYLIKK